MSEQKFRIESDLLGELKVPADVLYGVQTQRGINNYHISRKTMSMYPDFIKAIEIMGHEKGDYQYCLPNDHCNCGQSTNDVYPTTIRLAIIHMNKSLIAALTGLISAFRYKGDEFKCRTPCR